MTNTFTTKAQINNILNNGYKRLCGLLRLQNGVK